MTKNPQMLSARFSPEARNDLADIRRYTFDTFGEKQVDAYLRKMAEGIQRVMVMPGIGRRHDVIQRWKANAGELASVV